MSQAARPPICGRRRVPGVPPALATGATSLLSPLRPTGAPLRTLPAVPRMAHGAGLGPLGVLARRRCPHRRSRAEVRRPAAGRARHGCGDGPVAPETSGRQCPRADTTGAPAPDETRLQPECVSSGRPGCVLGTCESSGTPCPNTRYAYANGVDTSGPPSECGGGVRSAECGVRYAECSWELRARSRRRRLHDRRDPCRGGTGPGLCRV